MYLLDEAEEVAAVAEVVEAVEAMVGIMVAQRNTGKYPPSEKTSYNCCERLKSREGRYEIQTTL